MRAAAPRCAAANARPASLRCRRSSPCPSASARATPSSMVATRIAAPAASASSAASAKLKVCGPITTGQPQAAASIRFWPPSGAKLPPSRATSASAYQAGISRIESPSQTSAEAASPGGASAQALRRDRLKPASPISAATASKRCGWRGTTTSSGRGAATARQAASRLASSPSRVDRREHHGSRDERRLPAPAALDHAGFGCEVELEVAGDDDLARRRRRAGARRRPRSGRRPRPGFRTPAAAGHRPAGRAAGCARSGGRWRASPAGRAPSPRRARWARSRFPSARRRPVRSGARKRRTPPGVSHGSQAWRSPSRSSSWPAARPVAVPWVSSRRRPGRACAKRGDQRRRGAGLAERDRMDPERARRHGVAVAADALADRGRVERLGAAAPEHAQQVERQADPQQQRVGGARPRAGRARSSPALAALGGGAAAGRLHLLPGRPHRVDRRRRAAFDRDLVAMPVALLRAGAPGGRMVVDLHMRQVERDRDVARARCRRRSRRRSPPGDR